MVSTNPTIDFNTHGKMAKTLINGDMAKAQVNISLSQKRIYPPVFTQLLTDFM